MEKFIGIDIGGTNVKIGLIDIKGTLLEVDKYPTKELLDTGDFMKAFAGVLKTHLDKHPDVKKVGMGVPGLVSKDGKSLVELANVPVLNGYPMVTYLEKEFKNIKFFLDNDANAAALGEYYFSQEAIPESYIFITLGTGVGGGCIIDKKVFRGANGNAMEIGHILTHSGRTVETHIGKKGLVAFAKKEMAKGKKSKLEKAEEIDAKAIVKAAKKGDRVALKTLDMMGTVLGECIVSCIRTLDVHTVLIGGGVAKAYDLFKDSMIDTIEEWLSSYYTKDLTIKLATLGNDAGMIGAAALCFMDEPEAKTTTKTTASKTTKKTNQ